MPDEIRTILITEVDPTTRAIRGRDEHGQLLAVTNQFLQPLITVPQAGETWMVKRHGSEWLLDRRWDSDDKFLDLKAGDVHIDAKNDLIISAAQKILVNGEELKNDIKVVKDDAIGSTLSAKGIRFKSNNLTHSIVKNEEDDVIDIWTSSKSQTVSYGTSFPIGPMDGQEYTLVDSITAPTYQWRFRYNAKRIDANKWEFIGGTPWRLIYDGVGTQFFNIAFSSTGDGFFWYQNATAINAPRAGVWRIEGQMEYHAGATATQALAAFNYISPTRYHMDAGSEGGATVDAGHWGTLTTRGQRNCPINTSIGICWTSTDLNNTTIYDTITEIWPVALA